LHGPFSLSLSQTYLDGKSSANETGVVAKGSNTPARLILQELEVIQRAAATGKPRQYVFPSALLLVAMCKVDERVLEWELVLGQFL